MLNDDCIVFERNLKPKCKNCNYLGFSSDGIGNFYTCRWVPSDVNGWVLPCEDIKNYMKDN